MKRVWGHVLAGVAMSAGIAIAGAMPACAHDDSTIFISEVMAPQFVTPGMECIFTADPTQPHISGGTLDVGFSSEYQAEVLLGNQTIPRGDPNQPQTETSYVTIEGAVVRVTDSAGNQLTSYTTRVGITIAPSSGTTPGYSVTNVAMVDTATVRALDVPNKGAVDIISNVRFFGHTLGGESVESNEFAFPISLCYGCLVGYASACSGKAAGSGTTSVPCIRGQDAFTPCAACQDLAVCRTNNPIVTDAGAD